MTDNNMTPNEILILDLLDKLDELSAQKKRMLKEFNGQIKDMDHRIRELRENRQQLDLPIE